MSQRVSDLGHHVVWPAKHVSACEAEQPDIRQQKLVLAAIVLNQAGAMRLTVVLEPKPVIRIVQIWASDERSYFFTNSDLCLGTGQPVQHQQHSKAGFHLRLGACLGVFQHASRRADALGARASMNPFLLRSTRWIKSACSAMSVITTASTRLNLRLRSDSVRSSEVVLKPFRTTTSPS